MKGIVLAGGTGSRLWPTTMAVCKQLLPIHDKPLIFYPISTLMLAGIREILLISREEDRTLFEKLLGSGNQWGVQFSYAIQKEPKGIAEALIIGSPFVGADEVCLVLGDNILYGSNLGRQLNKLRNLEKAVIFGYKVSNPSDYGVVVFNQDGSPNKIIEKPSEHLSDFAIPGLYFYPNKVLGLVADLKPSPRGEIEISDLNNNLLEQDLLDVEKLERGTIWMDTGTSKDMLEASNLVSIIQNRQNISILNPDEIALKNGWISPESLHRRAQAYINSAYGKYLETILQDKDT
jgi:glucose-1-phosphate thymidylyltransferase